MVIPRFFFLVSLTVVCVSPDIANAQLFGDVNLNPNRGVKAPNDALSITGQERFVRGNRVVGDFVGAGAAGESRFVGSVGTNVGSTVTTSAVTGLAEEAGPAVNIPRTRSATGVYDARLVVDFEYQRPTEIRRRGRHARRPALETYAAARGIELQRSADGTLARLTGTVASPERKRLADLVVLFEPGIETVENELVVTPSLQR